MCPHQVGDDAHPLHTETNMTPITRSEARRIKSTLPHETETLFGMTTTTPVGMRFEDVNGARATITPIGDGMELVTFRGRDGGDPWIRETP